MPKDFTIKMETKRFNRDLKKFMKKSNLSTEVVIKKTAFDILSIMLTGLPTKGKFPNAQFPSGANVATGRTPVSTGRFRAGWQVSVSGLGKRFDFDQGISGKPQFDRGELIADPVARGKKEGDFKNHLKHPTDKWVELINNVHYGIFLESGWSRQAPLGMVRVALRTVTGRLSKDLKEELSDEWKKIF